VVDDEPDLRFILRRIFERAGPTVADAGHGQAALEVIAEWMPDLAVTDLMMPVMGGAEFIRRLRADPVTAGVPILAVTADVKFAGGADAVLSKPYRREQLLAAATKLLSQNADHP